jgi:aspartyl-tRNA(Asn)/glutamyl-tRNA(Gln) amidotransferase subunit A
MFPDSDEFPLTIEAAGAALVAGRVTSTELTRALLERISTDDAFLGAFVTVCADSALAAAAAADESFANGRVAGPLQGIPIAVKDIFATADAPTYANSRAMWRGWGEDRDAFVVGRLRANGAVLIGKATTNEFACGPPDPTNGFPMPCNPWNTEHTADGSSSGTGIAVAAGLALGGPATDSGGSIRGPAAANGITGLKPTFGRVSRTGVVPLAHSVDTVGPMARSAYDCALLLQIMAGHDLDDPASARLAVPRYVEALTGDLHGRRIGFATGVFRDSPALDGQARDAVTHVVELLVEHGAVVTDVGVPDTADAAAANLVIIRYEGFAVHRTNLAEHGDDYARLTREFLSSGEAVTEREYLEAQRVRSAFARALDEVWADVDVIVVPGSLGPAVRLDARGPIVGDVDFDGPWNLVGLPAIALPCGFSASGLPLSVQIVGPRFSDADVLAVADAYQRQTNWHLRLAPRPAG